MNYTLPGTNGNHKPAVLPSEPALYEAPVSINVLIDLPGFANRLQVTGRGQTGAEAAQNLKAGIDALQDLYAPTPPPVRSREDKLAQLLTCGLTRATAQQDWGLCERLARAAALVLSGAVEPTDSPAIMAVRSATSPEHWYEVAGKACTCKDYDKHLRAGETHYLCKHGLSVALAARLAA